MKGWLILALAGALLLAAAPATAGVYDCVVNCYIYAEDTEQCVTNCGLDKSIKPPLPFGCKDICQDVLKRCEFSHKTCWKIYKKCMHDCKWEMEQDKQGKK